MRSHKIGGNERYGLVLILVVASFMFTIAAPPGDVTRVISVALFGAVLLAAFYAAGSGHSLQLLGRAAVALSLLGAVAVGGAGGGPVARGLIALANSVLIIGTPLVLGRGLLHHVLEEGVDLRVVAGALSIYLLIGMFFGLLISGIADLASSPYFAGRGATAVSEDVYFSFITLATVGYGDYTPALGIGRSLSVLEGVTGQLYLVTIVALLVSNLGRRRSVDAQPAVRGRAANPAAAAGDPARSAQSDEPEG